MAVTLLSGPTPHYIGTEAERTDMTDPAPAIGSQFFESDTGLTYIYCGNDWTLKLYPTIDDPNSIGPS